MPQGFPGVHVSDDAVDMSEMSSLGDAPVLRAQFLEAFENAQRDGATEGSSDRVVRVTSVKVSSPGDTFRVSEFFVALFSTVLPPLPPSSSRHETPYVVTYSALDPRRNREFSGTIRATVQFSYRGWSLIRLMTAGIALGSQGEFVAKSAARMVMDDLYRQFAPEERDSSIRPLGEETQTPRVPARTTHSRRRVETPKDASTCAVLTFDAKGGLSAEAASLLSDRFAVELDSLGRYRLISRAKMAELLAAQKFSTTCSASECAVEAGKTLGVQYMIYGSIGKLGNVYTVNVYLVNVESGVTEASGTTDQRGEIEDVLTSAMAASAEQLVEAVGGRD